MRPTLWRARLRPAAYAEPPDYVEGPLCRVENRQVWVEGYGYRMRRMEFCD